MKLSQTEINEHYYITGILNPVCESRLLPLGMTLGCEICPLIRSGDTLLIDVHGCRYVMNKEVSDIITVEHV